MGMLKSEEIRPNFPDSWAQNGLRESEPINSWSFDIITLKYIK